MAPEHWNPQGQKVWLEDGWPGWRQSGLRRLWGDGLWCICLNLQNQRG